MNRLVTIGIISYNDRKYLELNLPAILQQTHKEIEVLVSDHNPDRTIADWITKEFPQIKVFYQEKNMGFGGGHNFMMEKAQGDFYLCFNSDMCADRYFVERLLKPMQTDEKIACVSGKLLRWSDFPAKPDPKKQYVIDTCGLTIFQNHHVIDRGQGDLDTGQFANQEEIWGASGAAPLYRLSALKDVQHSPGEYFDRDFFMYKEDVDLSYRLRWAGWKTIYVPDAVAWHDRTAYNAGGIIKTVKKRRNQSRLVKSQSFINQFLLVYKNRASDYSFFTKAKTALFLLQYFCFIMIFEPGILPDFRKYFQLKPKMKEKAATMPRRIPAREMEKWFQ